MKVCCASFVFIAAVGLTVSELTNDNAKGGGASLIAGGAPLTVLTLILSGSDNLSLLDRTGLVTSASFGTAIAGVGFEMVGAHTNTTANEFWLDVGLMAAGGAAAAGVVMTGAEWLRRQAEANRHAQEQVEGQEEGAIGMVAAPADQNLEAMEAGAGGQPQGQQGEVAAAQAQPPQPHAPGFAGGVVPVPQPSHVAGLGGGNSPVR